MFFYKTAVFLITLLLSACQNLQTYKESLYVFGTLTDVTLYQVEKKQAQQTFKQLQAYFDQKHHQWHSWQGNGLLMQINYAISQKQSIKIDEETQALIELSKKVNSKTNGLFDPAIGKLIALWGFHQYSDAWRYPNKKKLQQLIQSSPSVQDIDINALILSSKNKDVLLDFGGIAKGYAVKKAIKIIENNGIKNAIINSGGDICVIGSKHNKAWNIAIRHPDKKHLLASVRLASGDCIMTSGGYERYYQYKGKKLSHIINPITGLPVSKVYSVSIIDSNAALADASATALSISPSSQWLSLQKNLGVQGVIGFDKKNQLVVSPNIKERVTSMLSHNE